MKRFKVGAKVRVHPNSSNCSGVIESVLKHGKYKVRLDIAGTLHEYYDREIVADDSE